MDVHASPDTLPELQEFLSRFQVRFHRPEARAALERYTTGLLTELPNKNCDTMAQAMPGTSEQRLQGFLSSMAWDEEDLNRQRVQLMLATATLGDGVMASVEERDLAGIGKRFMVKTNKGDRLIIILQDSGGVELYRESLGVDQSDSVAILDSEEARLVAAIIGRTLYRTEPIERLGRHGLVVAWHTLAPSSYAVGKTLQELGLFRFPTVSVITVVEKGGEKWSNPASDYVFKAESQVALVGNRKDVQKCIEFIEHGLK